MSRPTRLIALIASLPLAAGLLAACSGDDSPAPERPPAPTGAASAADRRCAEQTLTKMSRPERVGQLMMVGVDVAAADQAASWVTRYHLGGVVLTGSKAATRAQARTTVKHLRAGAKGGPAPFIAVTQEGGPVSTFTGNDFTALPTARKQAAWSVQDMAARLSASARDLHAAGITVNLAPIAHTGSADQTRTFGSDPNRVANLVLLAVQSSTTQGVLPVLSYFPGAAGKTTDADSPELKPFTTGIDAGAQIVRVANADYPSLDDEHPAVFSARIIDSLLRKELGFNGVVMSADLSGKADVKLPLIDRGTTFVKAGGDIVLVERSDGAKAVWTGMVAAANESPAFAKKVDAAATRILALKVEHGLISCG